eukprot:Rmarinus@m.11325
MPRKPCSKGAWKRNEETLTRDQRLYDYLLTHTVEEAVREFHLGKSKIYNVKNGILSTRGRGRQPVLDQATESILVRNVIQRSMQGCPLTTQQFRETARAVARTDLMNTKPDVAETACSTKDWLRCILHRFEGLSSKWSGTVSTARLGGTVQEVIVSYFDDWGNFLQERGIRRWNVWNLDEMGFNNADNQKAKVMTYSGMGTPKQEVHARSKLVTLLACISADGAWYDPFFVIPRDSSTADMTFPEGTNGVVAPSGWMKYDYFLEWIEKWVQFAKSKRHSPEEEIVLVLDGASVHQAREVQIKFMDANVWLWFLPPNTTHVTQPLDVGHVFPQLRKFVNRERNEGKIPNLAHLPACVLRAADWYDGFSMYAKQAFVKSGCYPANREVVLKAIGAPEIVLKKYGIKGPDDCSPPRPKTTSELRRSNRDLSDEEYVAMLENKVATLEADLYKTVLLTVPAEKERIFAKKRVKATKWGLLDLPSVRAPKAKGVQTRRTVPQAPRAVPQPPPPIPAPTLNVPLIPDIAGLRRLVEFASNLQRMRMKTEHIEQVFQELLDHGNRIMNYFKSQV